MNICVLDTETNGKAKNFRAPMNDMNNWPRITSLSYQIYNDKAELLKSVDKFILPDGWTVPTVEELTLRGEKDPEFFERNGMSTERLEKEGVPIIPVLEQLMIDLDDCIIIVCHNTNFDKNVTGCELIRYNIKPVTPNKKPLWICTMESSTDYCKLPGAYGKFKWPSLTELHKILFAKDFEGAHQSIDDVIACANCFFKLVELGVIVLPKIEE